MTNPSPHFLASTARRFLLLALFAALGIVLAAPILRADRLEQSSEYGLIARFVAEGLPLAHVSNLEFGDLVSERALANYIDALDFDRSIFLADDIESFRAYSRRLDEKLRRGHLDFAYDVFDLFKTRAHECLAMVEEILDEGFDFDVEESFAWKRKDADWPASREDQRELWRKKIKNEYVGFRVNQLLREEEAKLAEAEEEEAEESAEEESPQEEVAEVYDFEAEQLDLSPKELILRKYRQFVSVLDGHDAEWVLQTYLTAFTQAYDAHTTYLSPRASEDFEIAMKLSLTGIGAILAFDEGAARIVSLIPGGPAERDGRLMPGDRIVAVAQEGEEPVDILFWPLYQSVRLIRGQPGTQVTLSVIPATDRVGATLRSIELTRDVIRLEDRAAKSEIREIPASDDEDAEVFRLGVITLPDFYADQRGRRRGDADVKSSAEDMRRLLDEMQAEGVDGLLLDLRNNGGGSLPDAVEMTGFFIDEGPIVQVRSNRRMQRLQDPEPGVLFDGPLVVLVNRLSASASEILAAALQDYGRAIIVGDSKTHGKGTVQSVFPLNPHNPGFGSLKVTTAEFYRLDGRSTQFRGVTPDIHLRSAFDVMEIGEEFLPNVLSPTYIDPVPFPAHERPLPDLESLAARSRERTQTDPDFLAYSRLVDRLEERITATEISLHLDTRLQMAREERAIEEFETRLSRARSRGGAENDNENGRRDIILKEALRILRDKVELTPSEPHS